MATFIDTVALLTLRTMVLVAFLLTAGSWAAACLLADDKLHDEMLRSR